MTRTNRLADETSPYLLQHAGNPVDWYPWGEEALARAKREDKPILLSVGYSACHWCHVMAHESFEDEDVARVMNAHFVCIKVDREERPDLDKVYQTAHQLLTQRAGGWPLTAFLTPDDLMPFFAGTYFPRAPRHGLPGFTDLLQRVAAAYDEQRDAIREQNGRLRAVFARLDAGGGNDAAEPDAAVLDRAYTELRSEYDAHHGGFGGAPKFPHPTSIEFLLRYAAGPDHGPARAEAFEMARTSLRAMALGGLYDQLGGGFYRYSVDARWEIPHFEKMLYDNAQLLALYANAFRASGDALFRRVAEETGSWVMHEMQAPAGGYYATLDADAEGHEGKFYVWSDDEIRSLLAPDEYAVAARRFGFERAPNFEGRRHLSVHADIDAVAAALALPGDEALARLDAARAKLAHARAQRVRPGRDEKTLTSWNGLMIEGMARAGRLLGRADFIASATRAMDFVRTTLWRDGRLLATARDGRAHLDAYLDDYAFVIAGALELLQARWRAEDFDFTRRLAHALVERFEDESEGGFYFTSHDHERLVHRPKTTADEALPSGNGMATRVLLRLGYLLGDVDFLAAARRAVTATYARMMQYPSAHGTLLIALDEYLRPPQTVVLRGPADELAQWQERLLAVYRPERLVLAIPDTAEALPGALAGRKNTGGVTAYVCTGHTCAPPVHDLDSLARLLVPA